MKYVLFWLYGFAYATPVSAFWSGISFFCSRCCLDNITYNMSIFNVITRNSYIYKPSIIFWFFGRVDVRTAMLRKGKNSMMWMVDGLAK